MIQTGVYFAVPLVAPYILFPLLFSVTLDVFCQIWLGLLERLVNPRNILESPHTITDKTQGKDQGKAFDPARFLLEIHAVSGDCTCFRGLEP